VTRSLSLDLPGPSTSMSYLAFKKCLPAATRRGQSFRPNFPSPLPSISPPQGLSHLFLMLTAVHGRLRLSDLSKAVWSLLSPSSLALSKQQHVSRSLKVFFLAPASMKQVISTGVSAFSQTPAIASPSARIRRMVLPEDRCVLRREDPATVDFPPPLCFSAGL